MGVGVGVSAVGAAGSDGGGGGTHGDRLRLLLFVAPRREGRTLFNTYIQHNRLDQSGAVKALLYCTSVEEKPNWTGDVSKQGMYHMY